MFTYHPIESPTPAELAELLNDPSVRKYLVDHPIFTESTAEAWAESKAQENAIPGCMIRAIRQGKALAGWCGIQKHDGHFELAIVLSPAYWRHGAEVMQQVRSWASDKGHEHLMIHLPQSRPQQRAIARILGDPISQTEVAGEPFNTYRIDT